MAHYTITPLEKKSISITYEMYRHNEDGSLSWFTVEDHYRWGRGFIDEESEVNLGNCGATVAHCKPDQGEWEGCELEDQVACYFEFSDNISEQEKEEIQNFYHHGDDDGRGGAGWLFEGEHQWQEEDSYVEIIAPFRVDYCQENGDVIREVVLRSREECDLLQEKLGPDWYVPYDSGLEPYKWK